MNKLYTHSLLGLASASMLFASQLGLPSYAVEANTPNLYELRGKNLHITYSTSSITGQPLFDYQDNNQQLHFKGDEIRTQDLEIGRLVTVTIVRTVDTGSTSFSLLIPNVNLDQTKQAQISTEGITTVHRFSVVPQFNLGQTETYKVNHLTGTAKAVQF